MASWLIYVERGMAKDWKELDEHFLRKHYRKLSNSQLADRLGVTAKAVERKLRRMGLRREPGRSSGRKRKSQGCEHRYRVLALSRETEYLQCVICGKNQQRKVTRQL